MTNDYGVSLSRNALQFERELSYEEWESIGAELFKVDQAWQWWVGDWINYGEKKYGETYTHALTVTGKTIGTLQDIAWICREFESSLRYEVSFYHHRLVASLDIQSRGRILAEAEEKRHPASWVREQVRLLKGEPEKNADTDEHGSDEVDAGEVIEVFSKCKNRISAVLALIAQLEEHELEIVRSSIANIGGDNAT